MNNIENLKDLIIYQSHNNENVSVEVLYDEEDFWLTQKSMAKLFNVEVNTINYHLKEIFKSEELNEESVIRKIRITGSDGKSYNVNHYNLQVIIALGFKIDNEKAIAFRKWANRIVSEYTIKGWELGMRNKELGIENEE